MKTVGELGPEFALYNQHDHVVILNRLCDRSSAVVVYFFPTPGAPGCTREALGFKELWPEFEKRNIRVVGITAAPGPDVKQFGVDNDLPFDVVSDTFRKSIDEWGAARADATARVTFVLNDRGRITHVFPRVDVFKHAADVLALFPAPAESQAPAAAAPAPVAQATTAPVAVATTSAPAGAATTAAAPATTIHSTPAELIHATARASLQLLLAHHASGGTIPDDVAQLAAQVGAHKKA